MRHKAYRAFDAAAFCIGGDEFVMLNESIVSKRGYVLVHNLGHRLIVSFLEKLAAGRAGAGGVKVVRVADLLGGDTGLVPENLLSAYLCYHIYPILDELMIRGGVEACLTWMHFSVSDVGVCLGMIGKEV